MKRLHTPIFLGPLLAACLATAALPLARPPEITSHFSPRGGCQRAIADTIAKATTTIEVAQYQLTDPVLITSLAAAAQRGVTIQIVLPPEMESAAVHGPKNLPAPNIAIRTDTHEKLMHSKYAIIDGTTTITGSYNWSLNAENRNAENLEIIRDVPTALDHRRDFQKHWSHSRPYAPRHAKTPTDTLHAKRKATPCPN